MVLLMERPCRLGALKVLLTNRLLIKGGRSLGTIRPPAVTRRPGGLPCSLSSLSALPRLIDGDGEGFLSSDAGATAGVADNRRLLFEAAVAKVADAEGRKTCSAIEKYCQQLLSARKVNKRETKVWWAGWMMLLNGASFPRKRSLPLREVLRCRESRYMKVKW